ncbi:MAG: YdcF family protein [Thermotogota bacterium]
MILQKILSSFLEFPGFFITLNIIMFFYYLKKEKRIRKYLIVITIFVYVISTGWFTRIFVTPLENNHPPFSTQGKFFEDDGLIVVLGGGIISDTENNTISSLSDQSLARVYKGYLLYKDLGYPIIVTGGKLPGTDDIPEAFLMKETLIKMGVNPNDIYIEIEARNTNENAKFTADIKKQIKANNVYLVTSAVHMTRSYNSFNKYIEENLIAVPAYYFVSKTNLSWTDFIPNINNLRATALAFHEYLGIVFYKIIS